MNDRRLRQDILDVFQWDPRVEASHITIRVENGVVTLTGLVETLDEKIAAEQAIRHVDGVREIAQKIEVRAAHAAVRLDLGSRLTLGTD